MQRRTVIHTRAKQLRKQMSEPEVMLWRRLRGRSDDRPTFRRQHPIGHVILDFYCPSARLAVEVDGRTHWDDDAKARDATKEAWLASQGISVIRIPASRVYHDLSGVTDRIIIAALERRLSPSTARSSACGPPPASAPRWGR